MSGIIVLIVTLFKIVNGHSFNADGRILKMWYIYSLAYYSAVKRN